MEQAQIDEKRAADRDSYHEARMAKLKAGYKYWKCPMELRQELLKSVFKTEENDHPRVTVLVKTDFDGTRDAIANCLDTYDKNDSVWLDILGVSVGDVTEADLQLASDCDGLGEVTIFPIVVVIKTPHCCTFTINF